LLEHGGWGNEPCRERTFCLADYHETPNDKSPVANDAPIFELPEEQNVIDIVVHPDLFSQ